MIFKPGDTLLNGKYRVAGLLNRGTFGYVYEAEDTQTGERVAIKELVPALVGDASRLESCHAETEALAQLEHDHIVPIVGSFEEGAGSEEWKVYIVSEFMPASLEAYLQAEGRLSPAEALRIAAAVSAGLSCAHVYGLVHGDLRPANILLSATPGPGSGAVAKVADLGIACLRADPLAGSWHSVEEFVAGSQPYTAPEQLAGIDDDPRIDVYALGAILYRMLTGRTYLAFDQGDAPGARAGNAYLIQREVPEPPSTHAPGVPPWLDEIVLEALAKQPEDRYTGAHDLHAALVAGLDRIGPVAAPAPPEDVATEEPVASGPGATLEQRAEPSPEDQRKKRRRRSFLALAAVLVLVLAAIAIVALALRGEGGGVATPISRQPRTAIARTVEPTGATAPAQSPTAAAGTDGGTAQPGVWPSVPATAAVSPTTGALLAPTPAPDTPQTAPPPAGLAPLLLDPSPGSALNGLVTFRWQGQGPELGPDEYYDLRIWSDEEEELQPAARRGAVEPTKDEQVEIALEWAPAILDFGAGPYYWTVIVVRKACPNCASSAVGEWGEERIFIYNP